MSYFVNNSWVDGEGYEQFWSAPPTNGENSTIKFMQEYADQPKGSICIMKAENSYVDSSCKLQVWQK